MIGDLTIANDVFEAGKLVGKDRGEEVFGFHSLKRRGNLASAPLTRQSEGSRGVPAPMDPEHRSIQQCLDKQVANGLAVKITEDLFERERMLGSEGQHDGVVSRGRLEFKIE